MPKPTKEIITSDSKSFNVAEFKDNVIKGGIIGSISTTVTFATIDKPLAHATRTSAEGVPSHHSFKWFAQEAGKRNFSSLWTNSLYIKAYYAAWQHPIKGYPVALVNSCMKNIVFFPTKYAVEKGLESVMSTDIETSYSGFLAGIATVYTTTPISVLKARMMTNVPVKNMGLKRFMSGVNAIALRDGLQYGIYFNTLEFFKANFGNNFMAAGAAGITGYIISNPLSVVGLNQKTSLESLNMVNMAKKIYKASGLKGFYPLVALSTMGMFARGVAISKGQEVYESLMEETNKSRPKLGSE